MALPIVVAPVEVLRCTEVMDGVPEMIHGIQVEAIFPGGIKLVTMHEPIR